MHAFESASLQILSLYSSELQVRCSVTPGRCFQGMPLLTSGFGPHPTQCQLEVVHMIFGGLPKDYALDNHFPNPLQPQALLWR